eukprot:CAMPEP_0194522782 /NCGR_PEP_ID=MMETSP0253-20130528/57488_1 /TAXON_ID=2966 /ORGANISM="Noctiluca scintillans" /LENGTH=153 /DNA_ID=CAMNT_0039367257 /DNA_START=38 /DNA_END=495 /DNA_ORIENTATION=+
MRSSQAILRLAGGVAAFLFVILAVVTLFVDVLGNLFQFEVRTAMHYVADATLLFVSGVACTLAEIRPHPIVSENAPYLSKLGGRATCYLFMGMYVVGRNPGNAQAAADTVIGTYTLCVSAIGIIMASQGRHNIPPSTEEPALSEMNAVYVSEG